MRVLLVRDSFEWMGKYSGYDRLYDAIERNNSSATFSVIRKPDSSALPMGMNHLMKSGAKRVNSPFYNAQSAYCELTAATKLVARRPEIVHFMYAENQLGWLTMSRKRANHRLVATVHQPPQWWNNNQSVMKMLAKLDGVLTLDENSRHYFAQRLPCPVEMIPHGVDTSFFKPSLAMRDASCTHYLSVGSWLRDREHLAACVRAIEAGGVPSKVHVVWQTSHPVKGPEILSPVVEDHRDISDEALRHLYQTCHGLLLPLRNSTANNTLLEAMASGLSVISNTVGGTNTYTHGVPGVWSMSKNEMLKFLRHPPGELLTKQHSAAIRKHALSLDWNIIAEKTMAWYGEIRGREMSHTGQPETARRRGGALNAASSRNQRASNMNTQSMREGSPSPRDSHISASPDGKSKCGPEFICVGAQKAGTSYLHAQLDKHPEVEFPHGKEVHFWDQSYPAELEHYFPGPPQPGVIRGDITPAYAILPKHKIRAAYEHCPDTKLIFIVRNPIYRSYSHERMDLRSMQVASGYGVSIQPEHLTDAYFMQRFQRKANLQRSDYETCLRNWLSFFPRENLLVVEYDLLESDPALFLKQICRHLGLSYDVFEARRAELGERIHGSKPSPLRSGLHDYLRQMYRPKIESLSEFLDTDLSHWLD